MSEGIRHRFEYILSVEVSHGFETRTNGIAAGLEANIDGCSLQRLNDTENVFYRNTKRTMLLQAPPGVPAPPQPVAMTARRMWPGSHSTNPTARLVRLQDRQFSVAQKSSKALVEVTK